MAAVRGSALVSANLSRNPEGPANRVSQKPAASDVAGPFPFTVMKSTMGSQRLPAPRPLQSRPHRQAKFVTNYAEVPDSLPFLGDDGDDYSQDDIDRLRRALRGDAFPADATCGPVECTSRGCRPVPLSNGPSHQGCEGCTGFRSEGCKCASMRQLAHSAAVGGVEAVKGFSSFPMEFAEFAGDVWCHPRLADKYYQTAVLRRPFDVEVLIKYAEFSWQKMRNKGQAESLFGKALEEEPENAAALASYALFLWESESSG